VPDQDWAYSYDPIGNRVTSKDGAQNNPNATYRRNTLDQYAELNKPTAGAPWLQRLTYDADGNVTQTWAVGDVDCSGVIDFGDINALTLALSGEAQYEAAYPNCNWLNADTDGNGFVDFDDINPFIDLVTYGNASPATTYVWDGENRLVCVAPPAGTEQNGNLKVAFGYDYLGRRVCKTVYNWVVDPNNPQNSHWATTPSVERKFVYDGWLLLLELDGLGDPNGPPVRKYTWGLDLAGLNGNVASGAPAGRLGDAGYGAPALQAAGGIGGLIAMSDPNDPNDPNDAFGEFVFCYDGNGNVGQLIDWSHDPNDPNGAIVAKYEYDAYGNITTQSGSYADTNPFRFSTKYFDIETGLSDYGHRYYSPGMGRWLNRDPIAELGGANLYGYVGNDPVNRFDPRGLAAAGGDCPKGGQELPPDPGRPVPPEEYPPPRSPEDCARRYGPCSKPEGWDVSGGNCKCGGQQYRPGGIPGDKGPFWPLSCLAGYATCMAWGEGPATCGAAYLRCAEASGKNKHPRPSHEGNYIDGYCWLFRGTQGCDRPSINYIPLFKLW
jgi:RHS repeat-associated protein